MKNIHLSQEITVFHGRSAPETGNIAGYGAIIDALALPVPLPHTLALISKKNRRYEKDGWKVFTSKHQPEDSLYKQLVFALKYEGVNLLLFKCLFSKLGSKKVKELLQIEPTGQYSRKIWFLYEWLMEKPLDIPDLGIKNYVPLLDDKIQYAIEGQRSPRHRIINNLPGTPGFCPLIFKTFKLETFINANLSGKKDTYLSTIRKDVLQRASAFLLLKDSKASFTIEGENPGNTRAIRWGKAIGQAGSKPLSKEELLRLQQIVIENTRFTNMGFRKEGGFVGEHDRTTSDPLPEHISARWQDVEALIEGMIAMNKILENSDFDAVLAAAMIAFGFVFIHPFEDGNGRLHRYLIHHILAEKKFAQQGMIFPVSASILDKIDDYRKILESYSHPLLDFIKWKATPKHNVEVLNATADYYRYFDGTKQAEFLYDCVEDTMRNIIPNEVDYLNKYDEMKRYLDDKFEMPDKTVALLIKFLGQGDGQLSKRARGKELVALTDEEIRDIENRHQEIFLEG
ncbi:MAG TPA: cell filamentation protein Fic [Nitrospirae bacterium]|nr:fic/DOC family protein [bacterium BMS3Abin09]GBE41105.1 fic/DOC family protein [bacterium BMS3Bbin09]HDK81714.1 cell filamentation protein Fic [Nitrospirota bacterium]HDO67467.1 cell filamentation protein Fic [Nitrospirota bacterium]HEW81641.1 cell filamentation protein Fic [Nitrospirota bacterium]